jgi:hypothetical protein
MKTLIIGAVLALMLAAPAVAEAPTLDQRVGVLETQVADLQDSVLELQQSPTACMGSAMAISKRKNGTLILTSKRKQSKVYVFLVQRSCIKGLKDNYRWPGY